MAASNRILHREGPKSGFCNLGWLAVGALWIAAAGGVSEVRGQQSEKPGFGAGAGAGALNKMAHKAAGEMDIRLQPVEKDLPLIREQSDPILQARMRIRRAQRERAIRQAMDAVAEAPRSMKPQDPSVVAGDWRFSVGNNGNWSPYPDRELDARNLSFPMRRDARADKRSDQQRALDRMRRQNR